MRSAWRYCVGQSDDQACPDHAIDQRNSPYPGMFDTILADAGIKVLLTGVWTPRMSAIMERWIQSCRRELLDGTLIWNQTPVHGYNAHPIEASRTRARYDRCPIRSAIQRRSRGSSFADATACAGSTTNTHTPHDLRGLCYRHPQGPAVAMSVVLTLRVAVAGSTRAGRRGRRQRQSWPVTRRFEEPTICNDGLTRDWTSLGDGIDGIA
jgi:hypothetical protein